MVTVNVYRSSHDDSTISINTGIITICIIKTTGVVVNTN